MAQVIGVDLGGSHVMAAIVDENGELHNQQEEDIFDHTFESVVALVGTVVNRVIADAKEKKIDAIGIGSPGNIDPDGVVRNSPNFGWHGAPLGPALREQLVHPVFAGNDARCATLGEATYGVGKGIGNFALLTLGTGVGGGFVIDGRLAVGTSATAGEVGHHQIRATDGFICLCGKIGCFEAQASGTGLLRHAIAIAPSFPRSDLLQPRKPDKPVGSKQIRKAAEAGDPHGVAAWTRFVDDLARGVANVIAFVNPEVIALGGGVSSAGSFLLDMLRPRVSELTTMAPKNSARIEIARLGNNAGAIGAAVMARNGGLRL